MTTLIHTNVSPLLSGKSDAVSNSVFYFVLWCHSSEQLDKCTQLCGFFNTKPVWARIEIQHLNN